MPRSTESEGGGTMIRLTMNCHRLRLPPRSASPLELEMLGEEGLEEDEMRICITGARLK